MKAYIITNTNHVKAFSITIKLTKPVRPELVEGSLRMVQLKNVLLIFSLCKNKKKKCHKIAVITFYFPIPRYKRPFEIIDKQVTNELR